MEGALQSVADGVDRQLDPRVIELQRLRNAITAVLLLVMSFTGMMMLWVAFGVWTAGLILVPLWIVLMGLAAWQLHRWPALSYRHASYRVDDRGIEIRRGVYWRDITNVPRSRVQHTDVSQGPLERRFGLGTLVIHTAGTTNAMVTLAGLEHGTARQIRAHLLPGATESDAV
jgi:membrane protein YdbS with pleckstrin-like domain